MVVLELKNTTMEIQNSLKGLSGDDRGQSQ